MDLEMWSEIRGWKSRHRDLTCREYCRNGGRDPLEICHVSERSNGQWWAPHPPGDLGHQEHGAGDVVNPVILFLFLNL